MKLFGGTYEYLKNCVDYFVECHYYCNERRETITLLNIMRMNNFHKINNKLHLLLLRLQLFFHSPFITL